MKLPFFKEKELPQYYLSLIFRSDKIETFVFEQDGKVLKIINEQEEYFPEHLDKTSFEELLEICDKLITQAEDELNLGDELSRTIYGLKDSWTAEGKIKKEYLDVLKRLSGSLGLTPIGFLTIPEAVVAFLHKEEGAPPSAILVDAGQNNLTVSLVRAGKVIEQKTSEIHQSPVFTVDTLLKHFETAEILPAKIVILNDEEMVQEFIGHQWSKSLPFLHLPQIVSLPRGAMGRAFALGIADQMGAEVVDFFASEPEPIPQPIAPEQPIIRHHVEPGEAIPSFEPVTPQTFGFLKGKDVALEETAKDIQEIPEDMKMQNERRIAVPAMAFTVGNALRSSFSKMITDWKKLPVKQLINMIPARSRGMVAIISVAAILLLTTLYYFLFLKANVDIHVNPNVVEKSQDITFSTTSDFKNNIIKGDSQSVSEDGQASSDVTGKKTTGNQAKGTVTIFNQLSTDQTIGSGTTIKSQTSTNLAFTLDSGVTIPAVASHSADQSVTPQTKNVNVTASTFGTEYNLPSGTKFTVGNYSTGDVIAKNDNAFSGGTKKEITAVSKSDLANLANQLIKQMEEKAMNDIKSKLSIDKDPMATFVDESLDKSDYDKKEGDEANKLNLSGTVSYKTIVYGHKEMLDYINSIFGVAATVDEEDLTISFENVKEKTNGDVTATLKIKAKILPKIDLNGAAKQVSGKSFEKAQEMLSKLPQVSGVTIKFSPNFPFPKNLPRIFQNIRIRILPNG